MVDFGGLSNKENESFKGYRGSSKLTKISVTPEISLGKHLAESTKNLVATY